MSSATYSQLSQRNGYMPLLPNVEAVLGHCSAYNILFIVGRRLQELHYYADSGIEEDVADWFTVSERFRVLTETSPAVEVIYMEHVPLFCLQAPFEHWHALRRVYLYRTRGRLDGAILRTLSCFKNLEDLTLFNCHITTAENPPPCRFAVLSKLMVSDSPARLRDLFVAMKTPVLWDLALNLSADDDYPNVFRDCCDCLKTMVARCSSSLQRLTIVVSLPHTPKVIPFVDFFPLLFGLHNIATLTAALTGGKTSKNFESEDMQRMARAWLHIDSLSLHYKLDVEVPNVLPVDALVPFARYCPDLRVLNLPIVTSNMPMDLEDYPIFSHKLRILSIGSSIPQGPAHIIALFLDRLCPCLDINDCHLMLDDYAWRDLVERLAAIQAAKSLESGNVSASAQVV